MSNVFTRRYLIFQTVLLPLTVRLPELFGVEMQVQPRLTGTIAYLKKGAAYVAPAGGGVAVLVAQSDGALEVRLNAAGNMVAFCKPVDKNSKNANDPMVLFLTSARPFTEVRPAGTGKRSEAAARFEAVGMPLPDTAGGSRQRTWVEDTGKSLLLHTPGKTGKPDDVTTLFSTGQPQPLFDALARAKHPRGVKELRDAIDPELYKNSGMWSNGGAVLSRDGKQVFFASNAGSGMGAAGNASWCLFAADTTTKRLSVLSKAGTFFGRAPDISRISPDGKRWFLITSVHDSAMDNSCRAFIVDLETQAVRELLYSNASERGLANLVDGACWSPDSRFVAISVHFYDVAALLKAGDDAGGLEDPGLYNLRFYDAVAGRMRRTLPGATQPSWGQ